MKKFSLIMMFAALGIFTLGCEPTAKPKASTPAAESDHMTSDTGEEKPSAPAAEPKAEDKPSEPAAEPKAEDKPAEPKPEDKPATEPKPEEKPADAPK